MAHNQSFFKHKTSKHQTNTRFTMGLHDIARSRGYNQDVEVLPPNHNEQAKASYNIPRSISGNALASLIAEQEAATEVPVTKENAMRVSLRLWISL